MCLTGGEQLGAFQRKWAPKRTAGGDETWGLDVVSFGRLVSHLIFWETAETFNTQAPLPASPGKAWFEGADRGSRCVSVPVGMGPSARASSPAKPGLGVGDSRRQ